MGEKTINDLEAYLAATAAELNELAAFDQMEMYRHLGDLGGQLAAFGEPARIPENFVPGCTSNVYIAAGLAGDQVFYRGSSEALIVRGYVAILVTALSGLTAADILEKSEPSVNHFSQITNIRATLTPSRANAFGNVYRLMRQHAERLKAL